MSPYSAQEPSYITGNLLLIIVLARPKTQAVIPLPQLKANFSLKFMSWFKNIFSNSSFFLKVLFSKLIIFENGRFFDPPALECSNKPGVVSRCVKFTDIHAYIYPFSDAFITVAIIHRNPRVFILAS